MAKKTKVQLLKAYALKHSVHLPVIKINEITYIGDDVDDRFEWLIDLELIPDDLGEEWNSVIAVLRKAIKQDKEYASIRPTSSMTQDIEFWNQYCNEGSLEDRTVIKFALETVQGFGFSNY